MSKRRILVVTRSRDVYRMFCEQITDYFHDLVEIYDGSVYGMECHPDLILASYREVLKESHFPPDRLVIARRTVDLSKTGDLVALPAGTKCLVVNNTLDTALETISCLDNLGLNLNLYPYDPDTDTRPPGVEVALVAETGRDLVPSWMDNIVCIGLRPIDYATILEIAFRLQISMTNSQAYSSTYIRQIVQLSGELSSALENERDLNRQMDVIFNTVHDGLIAIAKTGEILQANQSAYTILGLNPSVATLIGRTVWDVFPEVCVNEVTVQETIHQIGDTYLVMNRTDIDQGRLGSVLAFQDVTRLQKLEQDFRQRVQAKGLTSRYSEHNIIASSEHMTKAIKVMRKIARTDRTIIILGESGTGKELFAHAIHELSGRRHGPFLPVNFAGLPESLAESELFGYAEGAFTGARKGGKPGLFELAHNGTLFLDEIGDASPAIQALLLRVLQEQQVMRVGGDHVIPIDVRIIAATNRNLEDLVKEGKFRHDLYYRLFVLPLYVPALRERREDIPLLVQHFVERYSFGKLRVSEEVMDRLVHYNWPGNVRELEAAAQYMTSVAEGFEITMEDLPHQLLIKPSASVESNILFELSRRGDLILFYVILSGLQWAKTQALKSIGRGTIVEYAQRKDIPVTEQQVRNRLLILQNLGLIEIGERRQGSLITAKGESVLQQLQEQMGTSYQKAIKS